MGVSKNIDHIKINIMMTNSRQEPPVFLKIPNEDLKDMAVISTLKIKIESQNQTLGVTKNVDHTKIKIKIQNPSQEPSASSKSPNEEFKDMDILCTFNIKKESRNLDLGCIRDQIQINILMPNPNRKPPAPSKDKKII